MWTPVFQGLLFTRLYCRSTLASGYLGTNQKERIRLLSASRSWQLWSVGPEKSPKFASRSISPHFAALFASTR